MALSKFDADVENVSALDDLPNDNDGLSPEALKAVFDKAGVDIKDYLNNTLIPQLETDIDAAAHGIPQEETINGSKLTYNTVTTDKLCSTPGAEAVTTETIRNRAVGMEQLSGSLQTLLNNLSGSTEDVTEAVERVAEGLEDLQESIGTSIEDLNDDVEDLDNAKQAKVIQRTAVLAAGQTTWANVTVEGVTATNTVLIGYGANSFENWRNCGIHWTAQGEGTISFAASAAPSTDVNVNIFILP